MFGFLTDERANKGWDTINKIVQIVAVMVAAWWAHRTFSESVRPGLEDRSALDLQIDWVPTTNPNTCVALVSANMKNNGVRSFDISKTRVRGWLSPQSPHLDSGESLTSEHPVLIRTPEDAMNAAPFYSEFLEDVHRADDVDMVHLDGHYAPGAQAFDSWKWAFVRTPGMDVVFRVDVYDKDGQPAIYAYQVDPVCPSPAADSPPEQPALRVRKR